MTRALELAARGQGLVEPNPMVGCVLWRDGATVGGGGHRGRDVLGGQGVKLRLRPDFSDIRPAVDGVAVIVYRVSQGIHYL